MSKTINLTLSVKPAFPGAPEGLLGGFIQDRLEAYVEPQRTGTPRGETIGFSRKKYHAVLLAMTNIDLKKQAKLIGVSPGVLRTWRAEEAFLERLIRGCFKEFLADTIPNAGAIGLQVLKSQHGGHKLAFSESDGKSLEGDELDKLGGALGLGFEDAHLYSFALGRMIEHDGLKALTAATDYVFGLDFKDKDIAAKAAEKFTDALRWVLPMCRVYRTYHPAKRWSTLADVAGLLAHMQIVLFQLLIGKKADEALLDVAKLIAVLINEEVTVTEYLLQHRKLHRKRISATLQKAVAKN